MAQMYSPNLGLNLPQSGVTQGYWDEAKDTYRMQDAKQVNVLQHAVEHTLMAQ